MASYTITIVRTPSDAAGNVKIGSEVVSSSIQEEGATVNVLAIPASGFFFVEALIDAVQVSTTASFSFVMPSNDITLTIAFGAIPTPEFSEQAALYDTSCPKFLLVSNMTDRFFAGDLVDMSVYDYVEVEEPISFDTGRFKLERDQKYHGFNYEFSVDKLRYELNSIGHTTIKTKFYSEGTDSDLKFVYGFGDISVFTIFYIGKIDFNEYSETSDGDYLDFSLRELDFDNLLQTAFEVEQSTIPDQTVLLYSKVIPKKVTYTIPKNDQTLNILDDTLAFAYFSPESAAALPYNSASGVTPRIFVNDGREGDDLEIFPTYDFQVDLNNPPTEGAGYKYLFRAKQAGNYKISVKVNMRVYTTLPELDVPSVVRLASFVTEEDGQTITDPLTYYTGTVVAGFLSYWDLEFTELIEYDVNVEECVYLFFEINAAAISPTYQIDNIGVAPYQGDANQPQIEIVAETIERPSFGEFISPLPLLESTISKSAETDYTTVVSDFFDSGGCGNKLVITNGFGIRGSEVTERTYIKTSAKKLVDALQNLFCLGWGVEYDNLKREVVRVEPVEYFYQDVEIIELTNISDYQKEVDSSAYYNEIEVGFSKYSKDREKDKGNTIDDFHTKHTYQTPIKTNKNKVSMVTDLTLSGYEIEILRRKQFEKSGEDENANFREDEDLFGVQLLDYTLFSGGTYTGLLTDLSDGDIINLNVNSVILVGVQPFYNGQPLDVNVDSQGVKRTSVLNIQYGSFTPIGFPFSVTGTLIYFTNPIDSTIFPVLPSVTISTVGGQSYLVPESNQNFTGLSNIISPQTAYNLRYTPKRILYNWAKLFNGGFFGKLGTEQIVFKQGDGNVDLTSQFIEGEACLLGDIDRELIVEKGNVNIADIYNRGFLYVPIKVSFSAPLSFEQLTDLKNCLRGNDEVRDYGYITITSPCGDIEQIYPTSIEYSGVTDEVKIEGYLKNI